MPSTPPLPNMLACLGIQLFLWSVNTRTPYTLALLQCWCELKIILIEEIRIVFYWDSWQMGVILPSVFGNSYIYWLLIKNSTVFYLVGWTGEAKRLLLYIRYLEVISGVRLNVWNATMPLILTTPIWTSVSISRFVFSSKTCQQVIVWFVMPAKLLREYSPNTKWKLIHFLEANIKIVKLWDKNSVFWIRLVVIHLPEKSLYVNFVILLFVIVFFFRNATTLNKRWADL